jgi:hypothetical protein
MGGLVFIRSFVQISGEGLRVEAICGRIKLLYGAFRGGVEGGSYLWENKTVLLDLTEPHTILVTTSHSFMDKSFFHPLLLLGLAPTTQSW